MQKQTVRLFVYSSIAIVILTLAWGLRQIPKQRDMAERTLKTSLEQELIVTASAVKASTEALRFKLLDVLKAEGNDRATRAFQDSNFIAATLLEWDGLRWKPLWHSMKPKTGFTQEMLATQLQSWPLSKLTARDTHFAKVQEIAGLAYYAVIVPVKKPSAAPLMGVGILPANQFGLNFASDRSREVKVFDDKGFALALSKPVYLGASLKAEPLVNEMLEGDEVSARQSWKTDNGVEMAGVATRMADSNLQVAIETPMDFGHGWLLQAWIYLLLTAAGAAALNWWLFHGLMKPLLEQITQADQAIEQLRRSLSESVAARPAANAPGALNTVLKGQLDDLSFVETPDRSAAEEEVTLEDEPVAVSLSKIVNAGLRALDAKIKEYDIRVDTRGLDIPIHGDALQLQTAIEEILKNAVEAMQFSDERVLSVTGESRAGRVQLSIADSGAGVEADNLGKVFDPFFSTKDAQGVARGLGLNVVRRVIEEMNGKVSLVNRADEGLKGTKVTLDWPLDAAQEPSRASAMEVAKADAGDDDDKDDFERLIMDAPLVPSGRAAKEWIEIPIRRPKVRSLD
ncbi:MAG TPA: ATP-binding protein [Bdellovibrionales bacterium]|nr:ATP-binding protein [Bdellovibrionales bacterium]